MNMYFIRQIRVKQCNQRHTTSQHPLFQQTFNIPTGHVDPHRHVTYLLSTLVLKTLVDRHGLGNNERWSNFLPWEPGGLSRHRCDRFPQKQVQDSSREPQEILRKLIRPFNQIVLKIERCGLSRQQTFDAVDLTGQFDNCSCFINVYVHAKIYSFFDKNDNV